MTDTKQTPIVLIIFNRPDTTARVLSAITSLRPQQLFVISDGPRSDRPGEEQKCEATRLLIESVAWDCDIIKNYSDTNLGLRRRVVTGLDWVFGLTPEAIILEDDCLPDPTFFPFCTELLARYRHDDRIMMIGGGNFQFGQRRSRESYYFSKYFHIWGWSTWRRAWQQYDNAMTSWPERRENGWLETTTWLNARAAEYWKRTFQSTFDNKINSWAYRWLYTGWTNEGLAIIPQRNLVSNIGFGSTATHTTGRRNRLANMEVTPMRFPLRHPPVVKQQLAADQFTQNKVYSPSSWEKLRRRASFHLSRLAGDGS